MVRASDRRLCLVPARGGSQRVPRKNIAPLAGRPLLAWTVEAAVGSGLFQRVVVSTEDEEIARVAERHGAAVLARAAELATSAATGVEVCVDAIERLAAAGEHFDVLAFLLPTAPLRTADDLRGAWRRFVEGDADFLMGVTDYAIPPFWALEERDGYLRPYWGHEYLVKSQELPRVCVDNGAVYLARIEAFLRERTFYGERLVGYRMPRERSVDIDEPVDLALAAFFLERRQRGGAA
jgi:CMP-N-acetylneuraminic acid synthetase